MLRFGVLKALVYQINLPERQWLHHTLGHEEGEPIRFGISSKTLRNRGIAKAIALPEDRAPRRAPACRRQMMLD